MPGLTLAAKGSGALPSRIKLLGWGVNDSNQGPVLLDAKSAAAFASYQRAIGRERVALDFEHNTVPGTPEYLAAPEPRRIAAQGRPVVIDGDGLYLENLTWTATGQAHAADFEDLSPAPILDHEGRVIGLHSAALTRTGAVYGLTFDPHSEPLCALLKTLSAGMVPAVSTNNSTMTEKTPAAAPDIAALAKRIDDLTALVQQMNTPDAPHIAPLSAKIVALEQRLATNASAADTAERETLLANAAKDGKVVPLSAESAAALPLATLREIVEKSPKNIVPLSAGAKPNAQPGAQNKGEAQRALVASIAARDKCSNEAAFATARREQPALFA